MGHVERGQTALLEQGADEVLTGELTTAEVAAHVAAVLRRARPRAAGRLPGSVWLVSRSEVRASRTGQVKQMPIAQQIMHAKSIHGADAMAEPASVRVTMLSPNRSDLK